ncbi:MAG: GNAT family N-acetyltransferase, partial [Deltaproteobacteria bacterium]|nr:GNAT family N-acetyltransferase [Deltaproteobacteria bacterium]
HHLAEWGFAAVDHQVMSPWVETLGGIVLPRAEFEALLKRPAPTAAEPGRWTARYSPVDTAA